MFDRVFLAKRTEYKEPYGQEQTTAANAPNDDVSAQNEMSKPSAQHTYMVELELSAVAIAV